MITNTTAKMTYTFTEGITEYAVGFVYQTNPDGSPQIKVYVNDAVNTPLVYGTDYTMSQDGTKVVIASGAEVGDSLTIIRNIPIVQLSDYVVGRIDPEQIENDFDLCVERDQQQSARITVTEEQLAAHDERISDIEELIPEDAAEDNMLTTESDLPTKLSVLTNDVGYITGITSSDVTEALGYTPYDSSNPAGYNTGTVTSVNNVLPVDGNVTLEMPTAVQSDWDQADNTKVDYIKNKPTIPTVNNATITFSQGGVTKGTITLNQSSDETITLDAGGGGSAYTAGTGIDITNNVVSVKNPVLTNTSNESTNLGIKNYGSLSSAYQVAVGYNSQSQGSESVVVGAGSHTSDYGVSIGAYANTSGSLPNWTTCVGTYSQASGAYSIGLGCRAESTALGAIQIGAGTNSTASTFSVGIVTAVNPRVSQNYELLSSDGTIPTDRYTTTPVADGTYVPTLAISSGAATRSWGTLNIPTVNDSTITITQGGVTKGTFTTNQASAGTIALDAVDGGAQSIDAEIYGSVTVSGNDISNFSTGDYVRVPGAFQFKDASSFEIVGAFTTNANSGSQMILCPTNGWLVYMMSGIRIMNSLTDGQQLLHVTIWPDKTTTLTSQSFRGTTNLAANTKYYIKLTYDGTDYKLYLSTDGVNYALEASDTATYLPETNANGYYLGPRPDSTGTMIAILHMDTWSIKKDTVTVWAGVDAPGLHQRAESSHEVIAFQSPTAGNNYTWYRKYADGWVEQGGYATTSGNTGAQITLPVTMSDAHYLINGTCNNDTTGGAFHFMIYENQTTTGFAASPAYAGEWRTGAFYWEVRGMAAN